MPVADILYKEIDGIALATFNRPDVLNAIRQQTLEELFDILAATAANDDVRILILIGAGRAFSSGIDLEELGEMLDDPDAEIDDELLERLQNLTRTIIEHPKPVIAAINGVAVGLGTEISLACDLRIAADTVRLGFVEATRGLFMTNGVMYLLPRLIGYGRAMELLLSGWMINANEALHAGLVNRVVREDRLLSEAMSIAHRVADNAPIPVRLTKTVLRQTWDVDLDQMLDLELDALRLCLASEDLREGTRAFLEKRKPVYRGR
jgi:enoyl-CoA hydratase/carnithine racemase